MRVLYNGDAPAVLNRPQTRGAVLERASKNNANGSWPEGIGGRPKQCINGRTKAVFLGTLSHPDGFRFKQQMVIRGRNVNPARSDRFSIDSMGRRQVASGVENFR